MTSTEKPDSKKAKPAELSEEDLKLKEELELLVTRVLDPELGIQKIALQTIGNRIQESIGTMTSIPKPLKFLKEHFPRLIEAHESMNNSNSELFADILSVLSLTVTDPESACCLKYRLQGSKSFTEWGHEYVRHLCGELSTEWVTRSQQSRDVSDLLPLVQDIVEYHMSHSAESEAVDLLLEIERLRDLRAHITPQNWKRVTSYLVASSLFLVHDECESVRRTCVDVLLDQQQLTDALRVAMMINDPQLATRIFNLSANPAEKKQMALMLGTQQMFLPLEDPELAAIINNEHVSEHFLSLARELDVLEPKLPHEVFKIPASAGGPDNARTNLAHTIVNALVNAGFCNDKLMNASTSATQNPWVWKNKDHGMLSAVASIGMIMMWDINNGLPCIDRFTYTDNEYVTAGALLGCGIVSAGIRNECDPALAILAPRINDKSQWIRNCSLLGLGLAYAGSAREDFLELLLPCIQDPSTPMEVVCIGALSVGLVFLSSCHAEVAEVLLQCLMDRSADLQHPLCRFLCLGLGLVYLGKGDAAELMMEACRAIEGSMSEFCVVTIQLCAYACSGDVQNMQSLLAIAGRHPAKKEPTGDEEEPTEQQLKEKEAEEAQFSRVVQIAVLGLGVVAQGEDIGVQMTTRMTNHLMQFGDAAAKRAVPLCLATLSTSNAEYRVEVIETLQKLTHDSDSETSMAAIFALGIIGAGTNNSRIADALRHLALFYEREANQLFVVRLAQGFLHMGKGLLSISPFHSDRALVRPSALAGLLAVFYSSLDFKNIILQKYHWLLYSVCLAMHPRMLVCLDTDLKPLQVTVRVGQAVDTVGQAGNPKTITGFQTHTTPVVIRHTERAELATDDYTPLTSVLEGLVIVTPNSQLDK